MKNNYIGRVPGAGHLDGIPAVVYGLSGRSDPSKERKVYIFDGYRVWVGPMKMREGVTEPRKLSDFELTEEQAAKAPIFFYDCMVADNNTGSAIVSNGEHTHNIAMDFLLTEKEIDQVLLDTLRFQEAEPDGYRTPRVAALYDGGGGSDPANVAAGIITEFDMAAERFSYEEGELGDTGIVIASTYWGKEGTNEVIIPDLSGEWYRVVRFESRKAEDLAQEMWEWMDPAYRVATVAAMQEDGRWKLAVRNLHGD